MFFPRLRRRAKWVFALLAVAFGLGFVAFGVGTGISGTSLGDVLQDFLGRQSGGPDVEQAREKLREDPGNPESLRELATALQGAGENREAIATLERYLNLRPNDAEAIQQLAGLWGSEAAKARRAAETANAEAQEANLAQTFAQADESPFVQELFSNRISDSLGGLAGERGVEAQSRLAEAAERQTAAYERLAKLRPNDPSVFLYLGEAAFTAGQADAAIEAWERFLELAPDDSSAPFVRERLRLLRGQTTG
jgi:tetratricopeptide (TPR) repeat protein